MRLEFDQLEENGDKIATMSASERERLAGEASDAGITLSYAIGLTAEHDGSSLEEGERREGLRFMTSMIKAVGVNRPGLRGDPIQWEDRSWALEAGFRPRYGSGRFGCCSTR
jgi:D-psicose/D-tagatose/L-ribulose 3-epimerase